MRSDRRFSLWRVWRHVSSAVSRERRTRIRVPRTGRGREAGGSVVEVQDPSGLARRFADRPTARLGSEIQRKSQRPSTTLRPTANCFLRRLKGYAHESLAAYRTAYPTPRPEVEHRPVLGAIEHCANRHVRTCACEKAAPTTANKPYSSAAWTMRSCGAVCNSLRHRERRLRGNRSISDVSRPARRRSRSAA